ncbi:UNVERIFIED_CONTAM: Subtilisin-like protease SBT4.6 [Sesamum radiatum]|uniref:Subtilisin-like protease SBT4.6 n=1 Tax=Sesamum radiatum TaxID=300843 RepID=A0AAW2MZN8_SESRA
MTALQLDLFMQCKKILTVHSGNDGFFPGSVISVAPWLFTTGASNIDRGIVTKVSLGNGKTIVCRSCSPGCLDRKMVSGNVVLCDSNIGIIVALSAGAAGIIAKSGVEYDVSFVVPLPASALLIDDLKLIKDYTNSTNAAKAIISTSESIKNTNAPLVASFPSKGPNPIITDILKPDITAPGVEILAAYSPVGSVSNFGSNKGSANYSILSGTSMSCPHAAGAAAYVKSVHPDWSPSAIKSAIMTTGLVYETNEQDYIKLLCNIGYTIESIRKLFNNNSINCPKQVDTTINDFNYPSISLQVKQGVPFSASFTRTVTNVGPANSTYTARTNKPANFDIMVLSTLKLLVFRFQVYIVYMGAIPEEVHSPYNINKLQERHVEMLETVVDGRKLMGARFYTTIPTIDSAKETIGHGTHTAAIAAGNYVEDASFYGIAKGIARGGVLSARIELIMFVSEDATTWIYCRHLMMP